jgi:hypothetical protein
MKIQLKIGELVLEGFNYHDHRRIGTAMQLELTRLISKNGLPERERNNLRKVVLLIDAGSFQVPTDMNPRTIGSRVGYSVYKGLRR